MQTARRRFRPFWLPALLCLALSAASPDSPAQEKTTKTPRATYVISGTVINSATSQPISRAGVHLSTSPPRATLTDSTGHFEFTGVPVMQVSVTPGKPGYFADQELNPSQPQALIQVGPEMSPVTLKLTPEAVITGRIEVNGGPIENLPVKLMVERVVSGRRQWDPRGFHTVVILRGCDFFDFSKNPTLKTNKLRAEKSRKFNKVTSSERSEGPMQVLSPSRRCFAGNDRFIRPAKIAARS